jgi:hypothetical protein
MNLLELKLLLNFKSDGNTFFGKYGALTGWDTLQYTYQIQNIFNDQSKLVGFSGEVKDIRKNQGGYMINIYVDNSFPHYDCMAELYLDSLKFKKMQSILLTETNKFIVATISGIETASPTLSADTEGSGEDIRAFTKLDFGNSLLLLKGNFIDCITKRLD